MSSQSDYSHIDAVKAISNILREPVPGSGGESREKAAEILSEPTPAPASQPGAGSSEMPAESKTPPASGGAKLPGPSSSGSRVRSALWRFLIFCMEPIFRRLREDLLEPLVLFHEKLNEKLDGHVAETRVATERIQLQMQVIRADLDVLPKQLVHLEFQSRNFAKQLAHLESQFGILADQLEHLKSQSGPTTNQSSILKQNEL